MTQLPMIQLPGAQPPARLPGTTPLLGATLPGSTPTPHDPAADPFLALLAQLVGAAAPTTAPTTPDGDPTTASQDADADGEGDGEGATPDAAPANAVPPQLAALVAGTPAKPAVPDTHPTGVATPPAGAAAGSEQVPTIAVARLGGAPAPTAAAPTPGDEAPAAQTTPSTGPAGPTGQAPTVVPAATGPAVAAPATPGQVAPVAHQVFPEVVRIAVSGETPRRVVVRLEPEHLGEVRVVLRTGPAGLEVSLAAGDDARAALREGAPELRRMLEAAGSADAHIVLRHLSDAPTAPTGTAPTAAAPAASPTPVRTDAPAGLNVDVGTGTAGGTAHGDHRDRPQQDARTLATDGVPDRPLEAARPDRQARGLDVMM